MKTVELGEHARLIRGITFKANQKCAPDDDGAIVCMRTANVQSVLDDADVIAVPRDLVRKEEKVLRPGDTLVSSANSWNLVGKCCRVPTLDYEATAGGFISILRPTTEALDPGYLYRWFSSKRVQSTVRSFGNQTTSISNLDHKRTLRLQIPLPPLPDQKRIAAILDAADALRAKRRESLEHLDALVQSVFLEMFGDPVANPKGWDVRGLSEVADFHAGNSLPDGEEFRGQRTGFLMLKVSDLNHSLNQSEVVTAALWRSDKGRGIAAPARATVLPKRGGAIATNKKRLLARPSLLDPNLMAIFPRAELDEFYLHRWFSTFDLSIIASGSSVPQLNKKDLDRLEIPVPPKRLQEDFALRVRSIKQQRVRLMAHLAELDTLFTSLQSRAFRGEL